jgi:type VI secretion system secreted protein VgrG
MAELRQTENLFITLSGDGATDLVCLGARVREKLSTISQMRMEFWSKNTSFDPRTILGKKLTLETDQGFKFSAIVIAVEDIGLLGGNDVYAAELRPWLWMTTIGEENRIFQGMTTPEVIAAVFDKMGFSDFTNKTRNRYKPREYCVQYSETNFAFISRLMEEEGIHYYFDHSGEVEQMVLADSATTDKDEGEIAFTKSNIVQRVRADRDSIYEWSTVGRVVSGKVTLWDYDFELPNNRLEATHEMPSGSHAYNKMRRYQSVGHYKLAEDGSEIFARRIAEANAAESDRATGLTNNVRIRTGAKFKLSYPDRMALQGQYKVVGATHYVRFDDGSSGTELTRVTRGAERIAFPDQMATFETEFEVIPAAVTYLAQRTTPWPEVPSLLTATVTGPAGEEIHTDQYGRIRVLFPWDLDGKADEKSSCWVRTVMPWVGSDYGFIAVPRIGMEVIIQFERGNIDRPICTGMVYNGVNKPPYGLPGEMDTFALRTNSTKGGGGYHELSFKDKKDAEKIFFQSEKDYEQKIKNNAVITIGMEKKDKGDLTQTVYRHMTETIKTGDVTQAIETGSRITTIKTDDTTTTTGKSTTTITGDTALTIKEGNLSETVSKGDMTTEVSQGNQSTEVSKGNISIKASAGAITVEAAQSITLKVGANSVTIDTTGITIDGAVVGIKAKAQASMEGALVKVAATGIMTVSGAMVNIN